MPMKKVVAVVFLVVFAAAMFHYFHGEDHNTVRFPSADGGFGNVHHHHGNSPTCLCFLSALFGPEPEAWGRTVDYWIPLVLADGSRLRASLGADIAHPPNDFLI
jgi:hypothetical protein